MGYWLGRLKDVEGCIDGALPNEISIPATVKVNTTVLGLRLPDLQLGVNFNFGLKTLYLRTSFSGGGEPQAIIEAMGMVSPSRMLSPTWT